MGDRCGSPIILTLKSSARRRYVKWWRRDCWDSALTSSSPLNNPVIIPSPPGWAGNFPAKQHKQQQQKIIIHGDVPVFFKKEVVKSSNLFILHVPLWTRPTTSCHLQWGNNSNGPLWPETTPFNGNQRRNRTMCIRRHRSPRGACTF